MPYPVYVPDPEASLSRLHSRLPGNRLLSPLPGVITQPGFPTVTGNPHIWIPTTGRHEDKSSSLWVQRNGLWEEHCAPVPARDNSAIRVAGRVAGQVTLIGIVLSGPVVGVLVASWLGFAVGR